MDDGPAFPAHAGMNREEIGLNLGQLGLPRARGDEPIDVDAGHDEGGPSPRTRG